MNHKIYARIVDKDTANPVVVFHVPLGLRATVRCVEEDLISYFREVEPLSVGFEFNECLSERDQELRAILLSAYEKACAGIDLGKSLVHPAIMREKVEAIQRESIRERERAAASFVRRRLDLEKGDVIDALVRYYEHEFRVQRAKDIEDALIAGRVDEASADLRAIGQDALVWARWMVDARLFPANEAA